MIYAQRDIENQKHYIKHITAMTEEDLRSKSDIAGELAHRDEQVERLREEVRFIKATGDVDQDIRKAYGRMQLYNVRLREALEKIDTITSNPYRWKEKSELHINEITQDVLQQPEKD